MLALRDSERAKLSNGMTHIQPPSNTWWKVPINLVLILVSLSLGSYKGNGKCLTDDDGDCEFWRYATLNFTLNKLVCNYLAAIALFLLALTSSWF